MKNKSIKKNKSVPNSKETNEYFATKEVVEAMCLLRSVFSYSDVLWHIYRKSILVQIVHGIPLRLRLQRDRNGRTFSQIICQ